MGICGSLISGMVIAVDFTGVIWFLDQLLI